MYPVFRINVLVTSLWSLVFGLQSLVICYSLVVIRPPLIRIKPETSIVIQPKITQKQVGNRSEKRMEDCPLSPLFNF